MADFCSNCADQHGFPAELNVFDIFMKLDEGYFKTGFICEGCGIIAIGRFKGKLRVAYVDSQVEGESFVWTNYLTTKQ